MTSGFTNTYSEYRALLVTVLPAPAGNVNVCLNSMSLEWVSVIRAIGYLAWEGIALKLDSDAVDAFLSEEKSEAVVDFMESNARLASANAIKCRVWTPK